MKKITKRWGFIIGLLVIAAAGIVWLIVGYACSKKNKYPLVPAPEWLKVCSYNIFQGYDSDLYDKDGTLFADIERVAETILDGSFDIIGLQEINVNKTRSINVENGAKADQAKYIADYLTEKSGIKHYYCYAPAMMVTGANSDYENQYGYGKGFGLLGEAIISKYPISSYRIVPMAFYEGYNEDNPLTYYLNGNERRVLLIADVEFKGATLTVINTHFDHQDENARLKAVEVLERELAKISNPTVVMGDFNADYDSKEIKYISEKLLTTPAALKATNKTYPRVSPRRKIDWIFVSEELGYKNFKVSDVGNSDHRPITLEISLTQKIYENEEQTLTDKLPVFKPGNIMPVKKKSE